MSHHPLLLLLMGAQTDYTITSLREKMRELNIPGTSINNRAELEEKVIEYITSFSDDKSKPPLQIYSTFLAAIKAERERTQRLTDILDGNPPTVELLRDYMRKHQLTGLAGRKLELENIVLNHSDHMAELASYAPEKEKDLQKWVHEVQSVVARKLGKSEKYTRDDLIKFLVLPSPDATENTLAELEWRVFNLVVVSGLENQPQPAVRGRKEPIPKRLRVLVWDTYIGKDRRQGPCFACNATIDIMSADYHVGHVVAEALGGPTSIENLRPICSSCNLSMGTENLLEFKKKLSPQPIPVRHNPIRILIDFFKIEK